MKKFILIHKFGTLLEAEHNSRKKCEKSLIYKTFVDFSFHIQFFTSIFPEPTCQVADYIVLIDFCNISSQTLTNERKKQEFYMSTRSSKK
jgi:hypothetical protein